MHENIGKYLIHANILQNNGTSTLETDFILYYLFLSPLELYLMGRCWYNYDNEKGMLHPESQISCGD